MQLIRKNIDLILIILAGFVLRISIAVTHSYTNDELSAINRLRYENFSDLIEQGVKSGDMHPAGVQVFEKIWSSLFGTSELALRFPFVICGTLSIYVIFLLGCKWFNRQTGIYAALFLSFLFFPVLQSELARPYSPGLLIALLTAWFYHKVLFCEVKKIRNSLMLGLCFAAGMYTHYFLFLQLIFVGLTGLIFLRKDNYKLYFLAAITGAALYLPHIGITLYHLSAGGLGWLGKPENTFLFSYIFEVLNNSWFVLAVIFTGLIISVLFVRTTSEKSNRYYWLCLGWFFGIYLLGHIWSLFSTPVLKAPVLLFSVPFLLLVLAYHFARIPSAKIITAVLTGVILFSTIYEKKLFGIQFMGFKHTASQMVAWDKEYGEENIYMVYNVNNPNYLNFYANQSGDTLNIDQSNIEFGSSELIRLNLQKRMEEFCVVGYSEKLTLPQIFEIALHYYPNIIEYHKYENSGVFLLSREDAGSLTPHSELFSAMDLTETDVPAWKTNAEYILEDTLKNRLVYQLNNQNLYGPEFTFKRKDADKLKHYYLKTIVNARCPHNGQLTVSFTAKRNGLPLVRNEEVFWMGYDLETMLIESRNPFNGEGKSFWAFEIPEFIESEDEITISLWNRNGNPIQITSFEIWLVENIWN